MNIKTDIVIGIITNTFVGGKLIEKMYFVKALNLIDPRTIRSLRKILIDKLEIKC